MWVRRAHRAVGTGDDGRAKDTDAMTTKVDVPTEMDDGRQIGDMWDVHWSAVHAYISGRNDDTKLCTNEHTVEEVGNSISTADKKSAKGKKARQPT